MNHTSDNCHSNGTPGSATPLPVPGAERLDEGQRPFTDFGQFGYGFIDRRCLWQDVYWVDIAGRPHLLVNMSPAYRANVIDYLQHRSTEWYTLDMTRLSIHLLYLRATGASNTETTALMARGRSMLQRSPRAWMEATPLMRRLRRLQPGHTPEDHARGQS